MKSSMKETKQHPHTIPDVVLILGTDAAGKDHVANILADMIHEVGGEVQKRRGFLSGSPSRTKDSTKKSLWQHAQELVFLSLYARVGPLLPLAVCGVARLDAMRFKEPERKLIVVGHHGLRALAFYLGDKPERRAALALSGCLENAFQAMRERTNLHTIVIDIHHDVRKQRLTARGATGDQDFFDRYMLKHVGLGERIEASLVNLAQKYLDATLITNNDLSEQEIRAKLAHSFQARTPHP